MSDLDEDVTLWMDMTGDLERFLAGGGASKKDLEACLLVCSKLQFKINKALIEGLEFPRPPMEDD